MRAGSWSASQLTDGHIPAHMITVLGGTTTDARKLVTVGLWLDTEDGYTFHQWNADGRQPTRGDVEKRRVEDRQRKADARAASAAKRAGQRKEST